VSFPKLTDKETLQTLLGSGKLTPGETTDIQQSYDALVAGHELEPHQRMKANTLYDKHKLGEERVQASRKRSQSKTGELLASFDAMPRPKRPPGR
jgi:hypothetical protein